ncbi:MULTISPECIES: hypothetical protein [unclassified Aureispira]|uniref:hypothetical protein n=1 Tax=unclassified Aureispira TaxID=2649989 RepID=UPI00069835C1|nr:MULTISPECIES: hypothetical protein [unclassified Aureispira]WMX15691.1 hypothetical protein QP953_04760 [Aureispira sp. CCB-E]
MDKKSFIIGLIVGCLVTMCVCLIGVNYYVDQKIEAAKEEARKHYEVLQEKWETEYRAELAHLKEYANKKATEKGTELVEKASDKFKKYWNKNQEEPDSTEME